MTRKARFATLSIFLAAALALAAPRATYRIALRDGSTILARDKPRPAGSVMVFHRLRDGRLTGVPRESVASVMTGARLEGVLRVSAAAPQPATPMLQPGEVVVIGPTAPGTVAAAEESTVSGLKPATVSGGVYDPRNPLYGYSPPRTGSSPAYSTASGVATPVAPGDLARALSAEPPNLEPSVASNGFPTAQGTAAPLIGSDGQPILAPAGAPGSTPTTIGANGTPVFSTPGAGSANPLIIGPNGTPILASPGMPGASPNPVGANGAPVLATPGAPGSTSPAVGSNGTPVLAPPGAPGSAATSPSVGSNGYPASPAPGK